jgi:membrane carboxypeptidase/penicillin-binding protein
MARFSVGLLAVLGVALVAAILWFVSSYAALTSGLPAVTALPDLLGEDGVFRQPTRLYDRTGTQLLVTLQNPNTTEAEYVYLEVLPEDVVNATLAMLDPEFWQHPGFRPGTQPPGIAERLAADLLLWSEPESPQKTWRLRLLAAQITRIYGRDTVLEWYLNNAAYGQMAYGIDEAARVFFGKPAVDLSLAEAALLAAAAGTPDLNPIDAPQVAAERQNQILQRMRDLGMITAQQALSANQEPLLLLTTALPLPMAAPDFTRLAIEALDSALGPDRAARGGYEVVTSVDLDLQTQAECTRQAQLDRLTGILPLDSLGNRPCPAAALLPRLNRDDVLTGAELDAGVLILDPVTGEVLAAAGDVDSVHTPGTILSPFIYLTAFTRGMGPASLVWDIPASLPQSMVGYQNFDGEHLGPMRIRTAAADDRLVPLLSVLAQVGPENAWLTAQQSGIKSYSLLPGTDPYAPLLDQGQISLLELTHAYSMFANLGTLAGADPTPAARESSIQPRIILQVRTGGQNIPIHTAVTRSVTTPQLAFLVTDILSDETARRASLGNPNDFEIARPVAARYGQSLTDNTVWAVGFTPQQVVGVWVSGTSGLPVSTEGSLDPQAAGGIWHAMMKTALQDEAVADWADPVGIVRLTVCDPSGMLPTDECPQTVSEVFITGSEPLQADSLYRSFLVNIQTGRLATIYTPEEFVENRVYLVFPPEAVDWAAAKGLPLPPDTYDVLFDPGPASETAGILMPEIFSYVSGLVEIKGNAGGEGFTAFQVRIGEGLNPRQWLQIGEGRAPTRGGTLAEWDTSGLNGLYAIQLQVIRQDQSIETESLQVTVDNLSPSLQILRPLDGELFDWPDQRDITIQAQADDNVGLRRVEFWVNGSLISTIADPPYTFPWQGTVGEHQLEIRAFDLAGNITIKTLSIELVP